MTGRDRRGEGRERQGVIEKREREIVALNIRERRREGGRGGIMRGREKRGRGRESRRDRWS